MATKPPSSFARELLSLASPMPENCGVQLVQLRMKLQVLLVDQRWDFMVRLYDFPTSQDEILSADALSPGNSMKLLKIMIFNR